MLKLRTATLDDVPLLKIWDMKPHVIAISGADGGGNYDWEYEISQDFDWYECLIAEVDGKPIGVVQIIDPATEITHYWGDCGPNLKAIDIWIGEEDEIGKGHGQKMMQITLNQCFALSEITAVLLDPLVSNTRVLPFYERLGFKKIDRRFFGEDECFVYRLERADWLQHALSRQ